MASIRLTTFVRLAFVLPLMSCSSGVERQAPDPTEPTEEVTGLTITPDSAVILGTTATTTLTATITASGRPVTSAAVTWTTTDSNVARIATNRQVAVVQAVGPGRARITARVGAFTDVANIEVRALPPVFPALRWSVVTGRAEAAAASASLIVLLGDQYSYTSPDGIEWQQHNHTLGFRPKDLVFNGTRFLAVGNPGAALSTDGTTWTTVPALAGVSVSAVQTLGSTTILATATGATYRSADGVSWITGGSTGVELRWIATNGLELIGLTVTDEIMASADTGRSWTTRARFFRGDGPRGQPVWDGVQYVSIGNSERATSVSGAVWTIRPLSVTWRQPGNPTLFAEDLVLVGSRYYATANRSIVPERGAVLESTDGVNWIEIALGPIGLMGPLVRAPGGTILAAGDGAVQSRTGGQWTSRLLPEHVAGTVAVKRSADRFIVISPNGDAVWSAHDDRGWERLDVPLLGLQGIAEVGVWTGSLYVIGTSRGTILTSPDGIAWTSRPTGVSTQVLDLLNEGGKILALTNGSGILTSSNGTSFSLATTAQDAYALGWTGSHFVLVARDRVAQRSADGVTWQNVTLPVANSGGAFVRIGGVLTHISSSVLQTSDGLIWTNRGTVDNAGPSPRLASLTLIGNLAAGCGLSISSPPFMVVSADGRSWFGMPASSVPSGCETVSSGGGRVILSTRNGLYVGRP